MVSLRSKTFLVFNLLEEQSAYCVVISHVPALALAGAVFPPDFTIQLSGHRDLLCPCGLQE